MNPDPSKLRHRHQEEQQTSSVQQHQQGREFATVDELIRYDSDQTPVPPQIAERLNESMAQEPKPVLSWWQRLFQGKRD